MSYRPRRYLNQGDYLCKNHGFAISGENENISQDGIYVFAEEAGEERIETTTIYGIISTIPTTIKVIK
jgi:hypothetical protein